MLLCFLKYAATCGHVSRKSRLATACVELSIDGTRRTRLRHYAWKGDPTEYFWEGDRHARCQQIERPTIQWWRAKPIPKPSRRSPRSCRHRLPISHLRGLRSPFRHDQQARGDDRRGRSCERTCGVSNENASNTFRWQSGGNSQIGGFATTTLHGTLNL